MDIDKERLIEQVNLLLEDGEASLSYIEAFEKGNEDCLKNSSYNKGSIDACKHFLKIIEKLSNV